MKSLVAMLFLMGLPLAAVEAGMYVSDKTDTMEHKMGYGSMPGREHGEHIRTEGMIMLGDQTVDGAKAMVHLQDIRAAMAERGMNETHHFMVAFVDAATGKQITSGAVALKIKSPSGREGEAERMMAMEGHFGADIALTEKGVYTFILGSKVGGEKKRQFEFRHEIK